MVSPLHIKYRPADFDDVLGQPATVKSLKAAIKSRGNQVFVLTGPSGTGKTTLARICAAKLKCHPSEYREVDAATHTGIDHWRDITTALKLAPLMGKVKVIVVDEAHSLSKATWQSLLKICEDTPPYVYFFFCTTEAGKIPVTMKTRALCYDLKLVPRIDIVDLVAAVCKGEKGGPPEDVRELVVSHSSGSPRAALTALAQVWDFTKVKEAARALQAVAEDGEVIDLCRALASGKSWPQLMAICKLLKGVEAETIRRIVVAYFSTMVVNSKGAKQAQNGLAVLDAFNTPYPAGNQLGPLLVSLGEIYYA